MPIYNPVPWRWGWSFRLGSLSAAAAAPNPFPEMADLSAYWQNGTGIYQDSAGTTPATADGDPVGRWEDQIGGFHLTQATEAQRALLTAETPYKAQPGVTFEGHLGTHVLNNAAFQETSAVTAGCWFIAFYRPLSSRAGQQLLAPALNTLAVHDESGDVLFWDNSGDYNFGAYGDRAYHGKAVIAIYDGTQAAAADRQRLRVNRTDRVANYALGNGPIPATTYACAAGLNMGSNLRGTILEAAYLPRVPTAQEIADVEAYWASKFFAQGHKKIHVLGDSVPKGYPDDQENGLDWPSQFGDLLGDPWTVQNHSLVAYKIADMELSANAIDEDRDEWREQDVVILECGTNDGMDGRTVAQAVADMTTSVANRHANGFTQVYVQTLPYGDPEGVGAAVSQATYDAFRTDYNAAVRALAMGHDGVFDLQAVAGFEDPVTAGYFKADLTHLTSTGSAAVAAALAAELTPVVGAAPQDIPGIYELWKATSVTGVADGDPIDTVPASTPTSSALTGAGGTRPTFETNVLNGLPAIRFTDDTLASPSSSATSPITIFAVINIPVLSNPRAIRGSDTGGLSFRYKLDGRLELLKTGTAVIATSTDPAITANVPTIVGVTYDGTDCVFYNLDVPNGGGTSAQTFTAGTVEVGSAFVGTGEYLAGDLFELATWDVVLSTGDITNLVDHWRDKYGI
jgi:lysophospholipase L1-like esterase